MGRRIFICPTCHHVEYRSDPEDMILYCMYDGTKMEERS